MTGTTAPYHVLALYPISRGYAFVLFESPLKPFDWGVKEIRTGKRNEESLANIRALVKGYRPDRILIEDTAYPGSRRAPRIKRLYRMIADLAGKEGVPVSLIPRSEVLAYFGPEGATTKPDIARIVARLIPALVHKLPPVRKIWMSEDPRQGLFDAAALGVVFYADSGAESDA